MLADPDGRLVALGDIHGCADALEVLLAAVQPRQNDTLVVLGDLRARYLRSDRSAD